MRVPAGSFLDTLDLPYLFFLFGRVLTALGGGAMVPVAMAYAMIFGIDALLDMGRTACNVTGDLTVTCLVAKSENQMDMSKWGDEKPPSPSKGSVLDMSPENP